MRELSRIGWQGDVAQSLLWRELALSRLKFGYDFDLGPTKGREVVHDGDTDLDFGGLTAGIS